MKNLPSIFNNVLGPIMRGPSSSHTAASVRIGLLGRNLLGEEPKRALFTFDPNGSLATTYRGQGSAMGLAGGLLGMDIADPDLLMAEKICEKKGLQLHFEVKSFGAVHPNTYKVELRGSSGRRVNYIALSTGGGIINLKSLDGEEISDDSNYIDPLMPLAVQKDCVLPFIDLQSLSILIEKQGGKLSGYAAQYESALGGIDSPAVTELAARHLQVMEEAVATGLRGTIYADRILPQQSHLLRKPYSNENLIPSPLTTLIIEKVAAIMETKSSMGVIVAAPTAGSCGTVACSLLAVSEITGKSKEKSERALLAAGLVGVFIAQQGGFAAEDGGCQYECGAASGMAAAALVELMGGDAAVALKASSMALQNVMGLICDPVADRVEVPCLGKNIMAALNAVAAANMALAGFQEVVPLEQVIVAMKEVGDSMDNRFRCTCKGGLSITQASMMIHKDLSEDS